MSTHCYVISLPQRQRSLTYGHLRLFATVVADDTHTDALQLLDARNSTTGKRLFDVYANFALKWLNQELERKPELGHLRSSGESQMTWHAGNM